MTKPATHSVIFIAAYITVALLNYIFGVGLSWFFTPVQFGILGVAQSLLLLVALAVGSGFSWTANKLIAAQGLTEDTRKGFRTAFIANSVLGAGIALLLWLFYRMDWLALGPSYRLVIPIVGLTTFFLSGRAVVNGAARGLYKFTPVAVNLIGEVLVKFAFGLLFVWLGWGVNGVMLAFALGAAVSFLHSIWVVRQADLWQGGARANAWFDTRLIRDSIPLFVGMVSTALMMNLDVLGLKLLSPVNRGDLLAGLYQAAVILARSPVFIAQAITLVLFSFSAQKSHAHSGNPPPDGPNFLELAIRAWSRLLLPGSLALVLTPQSILQIFFPDAYLAAAGSLRLAAIGGSLLALVTLLNGVLQASTLRTGTTRAVALGTLAQIALMVWLIPRYGAIGAAISLVLASVIALVGLYPAILRNLGRVAPIGWPQLRYEIIPLVTMGLLLLLWPEGSRWWALVKIGTAGLIYCLTLWLVHAAQHRFEWNKRDVFQQFVMVILGG